MSFTFVVMLIGCNQPTEKPADTTQAEAAEAQEAEQSIDVDALVASIDQKRTEIENSIQEPMEVNTSELREKTKQKWQKIHFYAKDGNVIRIKTYPHEGVSQRTEEFYLDGQTLILAVIEDNGAGEKGKTEEEIDKLYYFHEGEIIKEVHSSNEAEYGFKNSDGEELLSEVNEYLEIYTNRK